MNVGIVELAASLEHLLREGCKELRRPIQRRKCFYYCASMNCSSEWYERLEVDSGAAVGTNAYEGFAVFRFDFETQFLAIDFDQCRCGLN